MKIQYLSDLHTEFPKAAVWLADNPIPVIGDILVIAGDFNLLKFLWPEYRPLGFLLDDLSARFKTVYWLPGNHEYYEYEITKKKSAFREAIRKNVFLVNNQVEYFENCRILFSTLWSKIAPENADAVELGMSDFNLIRYEGCAIKPQQYNALFEESLAFLEGELAKSFDGKTIVVTHHVPTLKDYPQEYVGSPINNGFATELEAFILGYDIDVWIYGHHHRNVPDFYIGKTLLTTNQLGYLQMNECPDFDPGKRFVI